MNGYLESTCNQGSFIEQSLREFEEVLSGITSQLPAQISKPSKEDEPNLTFEIESYSGEKSALLMDVKTFKQTLTTKAPTTNELQHSARKQFDLISERIKKVIRQVDHIYKIAARSSSEQTKENGNGTSRGAGKVIKQLDEARRNVIQQLKETNYFYRQVCWLQDRFPKAKFQDVLGLVKAVDRQEIEEADWSLTPGRYVGVAPAEIDDGFDFEQTIQDLHLELSELNKEAVRLANLINLNIEELVV